MVGRWSVGGPDHLFTVQLVHDYPIFHRPHVGKMAEEEEAAANLLITRAGRHRVIKWALFFFCFFFLSFWFADFALWTQVGSRPDDTFFVVC